MNRSKHVAFRLFSLTFKEHGQEWWKQPTHLSHVLQAIQVAGLGVEFRYCGKYDNAKLKRIGPLDTLLPETASWEANSYILTSSKENGGFSLELTFRNWMLNILLRVEGQALDTRREVILEQLIRFACQLGAAFRDTALLGPAFHITLFNVGYPRPCPPRKDPQWPIGSLVDFVSKEYLIQTGKTEALEKLLTTSLPDGVVREECNDLIIFRWVDILLDDKLVATRRSMQEQWFSKTLCWPVASGYNNFGDCLETLWAPQTHPILTFYVPTYKHGYKAIVQNPDGTIDDGLFSQMASWVKVGGLPDGTPLDQLNLILPNRESALGVRQRAKVIGIKKALYTDNKGNLWNPQPPGLWL
jgi:hypothetical protein